MGIAVDHKSSQSIGAMRQPVGSFGIDCSNRCRCHIGPPSQLRRNRDFDQLRVRFQQQGLLVVNVIPFQCQQQPTREWRSHKNSGNFSWMVFCSIQHKVDLFGLLQRNINPVGPVCRGIEFDLCGRA